MKIVKRWRIRMTLHSLSRALSLLLAVSAGAHSQTSTAPPPNLVAISERVVTSGQPSPQWLEQLKANGYEAVVYLAPATVPDAVRDEPLIVSRQGLAFVNIPIAFDDPTERDFETFTGVMTTLASRKVLVHCQINLRASSMVFLYRTIVLKEDAGKAYEAVASVWSPDETWKRLIRQQLRKHGIAFDPY